METVGFEPTTPCLQSRCSPTELRPRGRLPCQQLRYPGKRITDIACAIPRRDAVRRGSLLYASGGYFLIAAARRAESMGQGGLEPPTPRLSSVCSNQLSYWPRYAGSPNSIKGKDARSAPAMTPKDHDQACQPDRPVSEQPGQSLRDGQTPGSHPEPIRLGPCKADSHERRHPRIPKDPSGRHP